MCGCNLIPDMSIVQPIDVYQGTMKMLNDLDINLNAEEINEMKYSRNLWCDFIPKTKTKRWFNVRIGCDNYSIIRASDHQGFN